MLSSTPFLSTEGIQSRGDNQSTVTVESQICVCKDILSEKRETREANARLDSVNRRNNQ